MLDNRYDRAMKSKTKIRAPEACWLYFIECQSGAIYIGMSRDVAARYNLHMSGEGCTLYADEPATKADRFQVLR